MPSRACVSARACRWLGHGGELCGGTPRYAPDWGRLARYAPTQARSKVRLGLDYTACTRVQSRGTGRWHGLVRRRRLMLVRVCVHVRAQVRLGRARPWLVGSVLSVWVPTANRGSACTRQNKVDTMQSKERARHSRQRHLQDDRHGSKASTQGTVGLRGGAVRATGDWATRGRTRLGHPRLEGRVHSKVKGVEGSPCASGRDSRMVVTGSTKGEAERSRKQNRDGVEVLGWSGSWAVRSVASRRSPPHSSSGDGGLASRVGAPMAEFSSQRPRPHNSGMSSPGVVVQHLGAETSGLPPSSTPRIPGGGG
jgi:hypothetical protein